MSIWNLALASLKHYRWTNLAVLVGVALTSAILSGALAVGDSVRESLRRNSELRISGAGMALVGSDRFLTTSLADEAGEQLNGRVVPVLQTIGTIATPDGSRRVSQVQVLGVGPSFWELASAPAPALDTDDFALNETLARQLETEPGDRLILTVEPPGALSRDAPLSGATNDPEKLRSKVTRIVSPEQFGRYNLNVEQVPQPSVFLPLERLQFLLEKDGRANVLLFGNELDDPEAVRRVLETEWSLADAELKLEPVEAPAAWQLSTGRVFLDPVVAAAARAEFTEAKGVLTYLVNAIEGSPGGLTPYSMVAATDALAIPEGRLVMTDWLENDQGLTPGNEVSLDFFVMGEGRRLTEETARFTVLGALPISDPGVNPSWTPAFPGVEEAEDSADWEPGMPFDKSRIRPKDEDYWDAHRTTPKAFISLEDGQRLWSNRFGDLTSLRFETDAFQDENAFTERLRQRLDLDDLGFLLRDLRAEAESAVAQSYDFGSLFAGMSSFLILAALILTGLILVFSIEQRESQAGLLLAVGLPRGAIRRAYFLELLIPVLAGALLGIAAGTVYTRLSLAGLGGAWQEAAAGIAFVYAPRTFSLLAAWFTTILLAGFVVGFATMRLGRVHPSRLLSAPRFGGGPESGFSLGRSLSLGIAGASLLGALVLLLVPQSGPVMARQGAFFGGGFLLVVAGVAGASAFLDFLAGRKEPIRTLPQLGYTFALRQKWRSLSIVILMASGVFMVTAINSLRLNALQDAGSRSSGTGGFAFYGESALPIYENLATPEGREAFAVAEPDDLTSLAIVPLRATQGDDASCLNLNRAQNPRVLGVDSRALAEREAFYFSALRDLPDRAASGWAVLLAEPGTSEEGLPVIPAVMDQATAQYALGLSLGGRLRYESHRGDPFLIEIAGLIDNSIFQGQVIVDESHFIERFPDAGGYRVFLVEGEPSGPVDAYAEELSRQLSDRGLALTPAWQRLNEFNAVQNTYLSIFSTLGGFGVLLGTLGLAIVVGRNLLERRGVMGLLEAVGFSKRQLTRMVLAEHWMLHGYGVILGAGAALLSVVPTLLSRGSAFPVALLVSLNGAILACGVLSCWLAARWMLRAPLLDSLRHE